MAACTALRGRNSLCNAAISVQTSANQSPQSRVSNVRSATVQERLSCQYVGSYSGIMWLVSQFLPLYSKQTSGLVHFQDLWLGNHYCENVSIVYCIVFTVQSNWNTAFRIGFHDCILFVRSLKYERMIVRENPSAYMFYFTQNHWTNLDAGVLISP